MTAWRDGGRTSPIWTALRAIQAVSRSALENHLIYIYCIPRISCFWIIRNLFYNYATTRLNHGTAKHSQARYSRRVGESSSCTYTFARWTFGRTLKTFEQRTRISSNSYERCHTRANNRFEHEFHLTTCRFSQLSSPTTHRRTRKPWSVHL